jgi:Phage Mu protein F like protein
VGARLEPGVLTAESLQSVHHIEQAIRKVFKKQREVRVLHKSTEDDERNLVEALLAALAAEWANLPYEIQQALESAVLSGIQQGVLQLNVSATAVIASANHIAHDYAVDRAAELVGMQRDVEGNLVPNPNAQWAISSTTRDRIRQIVADAFQQDTPLAEIETAIQEALADEAEGNGIFSDARAAMIARTEVSNAQASGNFTTWMQSGVVKKVKWLVSNLEPCPICLANNNQEVRLGELFFGGLARPPQHPNCACVLQVTETET